MSGWVRGKWVERLVEGRTRKLAHQQICSSWFEAGCAAGWEWQAAVEQLRVGGRNEMR